MEINNEEAESATKQFQCTSCSKSYIHRSSLQKHMKRHVKLEFKCQICSKNFDSQYDLEVHTNCHLKEINSNGANNHNDNEVKVENQNVTDHREITNPNKITIEINNGTQAPTKQFQCTSCSKSYLYKAALKTHMRKHAKDELQSNTCKKCLEDNKLVKSFATQVQLKNHMRRVHGPPRFKCKVCFKTFTDPSNLRQHRRIHLSNNGKTHPCEYCSKPFPSKQGLEKHLFSMHNKKTEGCTYFKCELCTREYNCKYTLETHILKNHVMDKAFECPVCSKTLIDQPTLDKHIRSHDKQQKYFCDVCSKGFKSKTNFLRHLGLKHKKFFYCDKCLLSFSQKSEFDQHLDPIIGSKLKFDLKCQICSESFDSQCNLDAHTNSHLKKINSKEANNKEPKSENQIVEPEIRKNTKEIFQCNLCSKSFDRETYFIAHHNIEHPKAEWKCSFDECSKVFKHYNKLKYHYMVHSNTRPFVCDICQKSFQALSILKRHKWSHVKEKQYNCNMCPKSFGIPCLLRLHVARKHQQGPKPFKCPIKKCEARYSTNALLNSHLVSHKTTKKPFECEMCSKDGVVAFKTLKYLKHHERRVHSHYSRKRQARNSIRNSKVTDAAEAVFICGLKKCHFQSGNEKGLAIHYNEQHQLPKVLVYIM